MADVKALFFLPLRDNDGRELIDEIVAVEAELFVRFGGWTFQGYVKGAYRMAGGDQANDECAAYFVVCDEARMTEVESVLRDFKAKTLQESLYLEVQRDVDVRYL